MTTDKKPPRHAGRCIHCRHLITAMTSKEWSVKMKAPCPNCGRSW